MEKKLKHNITSLKTNFTVIIREKTCDFSNLTEQRLAKETVFFLESAIIRYGKVIEMKSTYNGTTAGSTEKALLKTFCGLSWGEESGSDYFSLTKSTDREFSSFYTTDYKETKNIEWDFFMDKK